MCLTPALHHEDFSVGTYCLSVGNLAPENFQHIHKTQTTTLNSPNYVQRPYYSLLHGHFVCPSAETPLVIAFDLKWISVHLCTLSSSACK